MYCITRNDMKFGDYFIPARTKAIVINKPAYREANIPGLYLDIAIRLSDAALKQRKTVPINEVEVGNELESTHYQRSKMVGIEIQTNGEHVFMDAGDSFYNDSMIAEWEVKKIFPNGVPEALEKAPYHINQYMLQSIIDYLENEFAEWVQKNCDFHKLTKRDIENGEGFDGACPGDRILSNSGMEQFDKKKNEYQARLETIGFTYDFKGGLIWD